MVDQTITIFRGDTININLDINDSAGAAIDITGYTFFFTVKSNDSDPDSSALIQKDVTSHSNPTGGLTTIQLSSTQTAITPDSYFYDIQMKDTSNEITTLLKGRFIVTQDVTARES